MRKLTANSVLQLKIASLMQVAPKLTDPDYHDYIQLEKLIKDKTHQCMSSHRDVLPLVILGPFTHIQKTRTVSACIFLS